MPVTLRLDLDRHSVAFDHDEIFKRRIPDFRALITRYRGTQCTPSTTGTIVTAWQKSLYRFGGIPLEETIVATILVRRDGTVHALSLDERSHGGMGLLCNFRHLQRCMNRVLRGKRFADFSRACPTAGDAQCLHLFEVLSAASSFYAHLTAQKREEGAEEELLNVYPGRGHIRIQNRHWVLGKLRDSEITLRHITKPQLTLDHLPTALNATMTITCGGDTTAELVQAEDFRGIYGKMNRILAKCARQEKVDFDVKGRLRFTNTTAMVGLLLLTIAHESMHFLRSFRIERLLHVLQAGGERPSCIAFGALQETYQEKPSLAV